MLFTEIGIAIVQQITDVNSIMYYGTEILRKDGYQIETAFLKNYKTTRFLASLSYGDIILSFQDILFVRLGLFDFLKRLIDLKCGHF